MAGIKVVIISKTVNIAVELEPENAFVPVLEKQLPVKGCLRLWDKEAYIDNISGLDDIDMDDAVDWVEPGTVALWPDGRALSLFFGPTPVSVAGRIRTSGRVFPVGRIMDINQFSGLQDGQTVEIRVQKE